MNWTAYECSGDNERYYVITEVRQRPDESVILFGFTTTPHGKPYVITKSASKYGCLLIHMLTDGPSSLTDCFAIFNHVLLASLRNHE